MKRGQPEIEAELEAFLEHRPVEQRVPADMRARVLDRARAIVAAGGTIAAAPPRLRPTPLVAPLARGRLSRRIAVAASIAVIGAAVGAAGAVRVMRSREALQERSPRAAPSNRTESPVPARNVAASEVGPASPESPAPPAAHAVPVDALRARIAAKRDPFTAELELLQRAHAAYTRRDFPVALTLLGEHARRFPKGPLAEQREALRVRSLGGSGRAEDARRAAAAFAVQFPRSVLLPRIEGGTESERP